MHCVKDKKISETPGQTAERRKKNLLCTKRKIQSETPEETKERRKTNKIW